MFQLGGSNDEGERVQTTPDPDKLGCMYAKIDEKEQEITKLIDKLVDLRLEATNMINKLDDRLQIQILYMHYLQGASLTDISCDMGYSLGYIQRINRQALKDFESVRKMSRNVAK